MDNCETCAEYPALRHFDIEHRTRGYIGTVHSISEAEALRAASNNFVLSKANITATVRPRVYEIPVDPASLVDCEGCQ